MNPVSAYRWQLSEALQSSSEPSHLYAAAIRLLGKFLRANRVIHVVRDDNDIVVEREYVDGVRPLIGRHSAAQFTPVTREHMFQGRTRVVDDLSANDNLLAPDRAWLIAAGVRSYLIVSLAHHWGVAGGFGIHFSEPHAWTSEEIELAVETADRTWDAVKRANAERDLRAGAKRDAYRLRLTDALRTLDDEGAIVHAAVHALGEHLRVNRAYYADVDGAVATIHPEYLDGVESIAGPRALSAWSSGHVDAMGKAFVVDNVETDPRLSDRERATYIERHTGAVIAVNILRNDAWIASLVVSTRTPRRWSVDEVSLVEDTAQRIWSAIARVRGELQLREVASRDAYRLKLSDALRSLDGETAILHAAVNALGEHLGVNRALYADIEGEQAMIHPEYLDGVPSIASIRSWQPSAGATAVQAGQTCVVDDIETDPRIGDAERARHRARQTRAFICVGITRDGEWIASLVVDTRLPRKWTVGEVSLVEDTAQRMWSEISRVRGEQRLREAAARDALRLRLADLVRLASDPDALRAEALRLLGDHLDVNRLSLMERDGQEFVVNTDYCAGLPPVAGRFAFADFPSAWTAYRHGEAIIINDLEADCGISDETRESYRRLGARALLGVPLFRGGKPIAGLAAHMEKPRQWQEDEVALMRDVGDRLWAAMERLHQERALRESEAALREAARNKDAFLAMLAHELRNPLAPLTTSIELLYRAVEDPRMLIEVTAIMERQLRHITRLVDDLLDAARISNGSIRIERAPTSLLRIIDEAMDVHRRACKDRKITLTKTVDKSVTIDVDHVRLVQVLSNLLHNAVKFTDPGGRIEIQARVYGRNVVLTVEDTGVGIEAELAPVIFELFHRAGNERGGLGVGLALCRQLVELHGGTISARARETGHGTVFEVRLPDTVTDELIQDKTPVPMRSVSVRTDVMLVDDNVDIVRATSILIKVLGATPHVATNGREAIELAAKVRPAAVLLDIGMPGLDGYEVCRQLRAMFGKTIRLVAYTGWGKQDDKQRALDAGFDVHVTKPADVESLARALLLRR
jgi:GAF domain-containing protein/CheY-like chemotaxis protein